MTIKELYDYGFPKLPLHEVKMILDEVLGIKTNWHDNTYIDSDKASICKNYIDRVSSGEPVQYVLGNVNFFGYIFKVDKRALIPRFETEELVDYTLKYINKLFTTDNLSIIDLGCGSGCIGITLKKVNNNLDVTCVDISDEALDLALENSRCLDVSIALLKSNMLDSVNRQYDVIISNPPYIAYDEEIEEKVKNNEPHLALYADNNGLYFYDKILSTCKDKLNKKFLIAFEIGRTQKKAIIDLAYKYLGNVIIETKKDLSGNDRMVFIYSK